MGDIWLRLLSQLFMQQEWTEKTLKILACTMEHYQSDQIGVWTRVHPTQVDL